LALVHCPTACPTSLLVSHSPIPPTEEALFRRMDTHSYLMIPRVRKWEDICRFVVDSPVCPDQQGWWRRWQRSSKVLSKGEYLRERHLALH
jgi:hypothetical protein